MLRRFALATGLIVLAALASAPKASAQSVTVDSTASVPSTCLFGAPTAGTAKLVYDSSGAYLSTSASYGNGVPANVSIKCNGAVNLSIAPYSLASKPSGYSGTPFACYVQVTPTATSGSFGASNYANATTDCSKTFTTAGDFITAAAVGNLSVGGWIYLTPPDTLVPPGNYTVRTTLTVVP